MKLYEINEEIRTAQDLMEEWAAEHDGDITDFPLVENLERIQIDRVHKLLSLACVVKDFDAEESALADEIKNLSDRKKAVAGKRDRWKAYIASSLSPKEKMSDARATISWRESKAVELEVEADALPKEFQRTKVEADKTAIKDALTAGIEVQGARLAVRQSLQIK